ncbi:hypothetical protein JEOAER750_01601 [Jeotgalicoccus aerolatus]|uniref:DUF2232 domain-containing protein n=1 Tax=Jeotgalicoccus aerolatus TaxID=709510 RepID=A0ABS4HK82_9STAP|nr:hypothetical protein [Jeotgalicoccus aerolatus]MBP1951339.1 hypothetical protein [Jeotgalicoccus aerolatus]GGD98250.1 hypothetical protein GCM10007273_08390 [Jeotgalicoccus aerolatus]CAD2077080.1 hypothetical protein JEOAER750_01601 [Jeotgalicoccus aerolatus]HJG32850.1 hypothetical protein [Jeotgalicoccus aerolatus]
MIEKLRNRSEVIISYILGIFFIILGLFILFNTGQIRNEEVSVQEDKIETIFDLISAFFLEVSNMLSAMIGGFPIIAGILIILFGLFMFKVGSWIKTTTKYDVPITFFFIGLSLVLFIVTTILMTQAYGLWALMFLLAFIIHLLFSVFNEYLNPAHRKEHYMIILLFYGIAYFLTQNAVYSNIESTITPTDVLSINLFFAMVWVSSFMALWVGVFLLKANNLLKKPSENDPEKLSRLNKKSRKAAKFTPDHYLGFSEKLYDFRNKFLNKLKQFFETDLPAWFKVNYIEILFGIIVLIFVFLEFNNRNGVFVEGYFRLNDMQTIYEWVNLLITLVLALLYLYFTIMNLLKNKYYHRQMIVIFILWLNVTVSLYITLFKDVELSLFILPFNVFLVLLLTPLLLISIFKEFKGDENDGSNRKI